MNTTKWLTNTSDPELQELAARRIECVQGLEKEIPAILIVHNIQNDSLVYMSQRGMQILGVTLKEIQTPNPEYYTRFF